MELKKDAAKITIAESSKLGDGVARTHIKKNRISIMGKTISVLELVDNGAMLLDDRDNHTKGITIVHRLVAKWELLVPAGGGAIIKFQRLN